jgi:hypothetical protein
MTTAYYTPLPADRKQQRRERRGAAPQDLVIVRRLPGALAQLAEVTACEEVRLAVTRERTSRAPLRALVGLRWARAGYVVPRSVDLPAFWRRVRRGTRWRWFHLGVAAHDPRLDLFLLCAPSRRVGETEVVLWHWDGAGGGREVVPNMDYTLRRADSCTLGQLEGGVGVEFERISPAMFESRSPCGWCPPPRRIKPPWGWRCRTPGSSCGAWTGAPAGSAPTRTRARSGTEPPGPRGTLCGNGAREGSR